MGVTSHSPCDRRPRLTTFNDFSHTFFASNEGAAPEEGTMRELTTAELASVSGGLLDYRSPYLQDNWSFTQFGAPDGPPPGPQPDEEPGPGDSIEDRLEQLEREQELNEYVQNCTTGFAGVGMAVGGLVGAVAGAGAGALAGAGVGSMIGGFAGDVVCPNDGNARDIQESE